MNILIACEDLRIGGAQTFALRLAQAFSTQHRVFLYSQYHDYIVHELVKFLAPDVEIITCKIPVFFDLLLRKFDRLLYRLNLDGSLREPIIRMHIRWVVRKRQINVVHSHLFKSDYVFSNALRNTNTPVFITTHGDYEMFLSRYLGQAPGEAVLNFNCKVEKILSRINGLAYLTDKNLNILRAPEHIKETSFKTLLFRRIYNGFSRYPAVDTFERNRAALGIAENAVVFGMVARGIPEKGWQECISAFLSLPVCDTHEPHLILVGEGKLLNELRLKYERRTTIHFLGFIENVVEAIKLFDVGILPTYYPAESLPNSVIEYLYCGKPVISTAIGEIPSMIKYQGRSAGFILQLNQQGKVEPAELRIAMQSYVQNKPLLAEHQALAKTAFSKFDMLHCVSEYTSFYEAVITG